MTASSRWYARLAMLFAVAAAVVLLIGGLKSVGVFITAIAGLAVALAGAWWFVSKRELTRWVGALLAIAAPVAVFVVYIAKDLLWAVLVVLALLAAAAAAGWASLSRAHPPEKMPEHPAQPAHHPFLVMNPRSGGGKVGRFDLDTKARGLGAEVALLEGPGHVDVAALAQKAAADGADLLGVAGGDGTQALVAGIAAEHHLPFLVISAGTRNHFAMDLGLDRDHPDACLDALSDGVELVLDLGLIGDRTFVNNASFGAYAEVVQSDAYRDDKRGTTLSMLPDLLSGHKGPRLRVRIDNEVTIESPQALLVSNNPYEFSDLAGLGRRARIDTGVLGVIAITVNSAAQAAELVRGRHAKGVQRYVAHDVVVEADTDEIPVGIDGEAVMMPTPVRCTIKPGVLRVRVPRTRPGIPSPRPELDPSLVLHEALSTAHHNGKAGG